MKTKSLLVSSILTAALPLILSGTSYAKTIAEPCGIVSGNGTTITFDDSTAMIVSNIETMSGAEPYDNPMKVTGSADILKQLASLEGQKVCVDVEEKSGCADVLMNIPGHDTRRGTITPTTQQTGTACYAKAAPEVKNVIVGARPNVPYKMLGSWTLTQGGTNCGAYPTLAVVDSGSYFRVIFASEELVGDFSFQGHSSDPSYGKRTYSASDDELTMVESSSKTQSEIRDLKILPSGELQFQDTKNFWQETNSSCIYTQDKQNSASTAN